MAGKVVAYVEMNPVRAGMVQHAPDFKWSSAPAHSGKAKAEPRLDREWWQARWTDSEWSAIPADRTACEQELREIRRATYTGRPFGSARLTADLEVKLDRTLEPRPGGRPKQPSANNESQLVLRAAE